MTIYVINDPLAQRLDADEDAERLAAILVDRAIAACVDGFSELPELADVTRTEITKGVRQALDLGLAVVKFEVDRNDQPRRSWVDWVSVVAPLQGGALQRSLAPSKRCKRSKRGKRGKRGGRK